ncbi:F0F1 ATP synthase subunit epsilon [Pseudooceanicola nanhaiensis]|uniref:F0F1 ATP synthase subunit epsilon n=1 Tax=Pseudooceanicola nanhaiensis TaxID=375761 RepID=UPI001CD3D762|nr:F0F1 ATP synthase subunit epsilon [Pseudooceanicola nanhaiensis]MCA0920588.1 F0F1 ATP synthase subunit epsilon [Pseudooceanicola nanhaiensis]
MANTTQFDLVSPERKLVSGPVTAVEIPAAAGDLTAMQGHSPLITTLRPGVLKVSGPDGEQEYVVTGGFAEISGESISVLAETALPKGEVTQGHIDDWVAQAHAAKQNAPEHLTEAATKLLADMVALGTHIGLDPNQPNL